ncbi:unnamed protein product [Allacma fusca]|uniref:Uncharacterized protein n=1 Tax=Allacma fusca TaxID=39272 RepID=A0A8J2PIZ7_9HEXA|nr:unnamed protein product [Allacma fusca]
MEYLCFPMPKQILTTVCKMDLSVLAPLQRTPWCLTTHTANIGRRHCILLSDSRRRATMNHHLVFNSSIFCWYNMASDVAFPQFFDERGKSGSHHVREVMS